MSFGLGLFRGRRRLTASQAVLGCGSNICLGFRSWGKWTSNLYAAVRGADRSLEEPKPVLDQFGRDARRHHPGMPAGTCDHAGRIKAMSVVAASTHRTRRLVPFPC